MYFRLSLLEDLISSSVHRKGLTVPFAYDTRYHAVALIFYYVSCFFSFLSISPHSPFDFHLLSPSPSIAHFCLSFPFRLPCLELSRVWLLGPHHDLALHITSLADDSADTLLCFPLRSSYQVAHPDLRLTSSPRWPPPQARHQCPALVPVTFCYGSLSAD
jgi:hypothetical protein